MTNSEPGNASPWKGVLGSKDFPVELDRYHLYVGLFCPFAHRVTLTRELKGLQDILPMSIVKPYPKGDGGWRFAYADDGLEYPGSTVDHLFNVTCLRDIYLKSPPSYSDYVGRYSVPVLWDKKTNTIVNNESEDIMRQLNTAFDSLLSGDRHRTLHFYPEELRVKIDAINSWLVPDLNGGVYIAGFAPDQDSYARGCRTVFSALDKIEEMLKSHNGPYILDQYITELDLKAYATLIRFDAIYVQHFKLNLGTIRHNFPYLHRYMKHLYWKIPGIKQTTDFTHIKENYSKCHTDINPKRITPIGPLPYVEPWTDKDEAWRKTWMVKA